MINFDQWILEKVVIKSAVSFDAQCLSFIYVCLVNYHSCDCIFFTCQDQSFVTRVHQYQSVSQIQFGMDYFCVHENDTVIIAF